MMKEFSSAESAWNSPQRKTIHLGLRRGIAVNPQRTVLTTLRFVSLGNPELSDFAIAFQTDFPENPSSLPKFAANFPDLPSAVKTSDAAGNFYVAAGVVGSSHCGLRTSAALVVIPATLDNFICASLSLKTHLAHSQDVALNPTENIVYASVSDHSLVLRFGPLTDHLC